MKSKLCQEEVYIYIFFPLQVLSFSGQDFWGKQHSSHRHVRSVGLGAAQTSPASACRGGPASCSPAS